MIKLVVADIIIIVLNAAIAFIDCLLLTVAAFIVIERLITVAAFADTVIGTVIACVGIG